MKLKTKTGESIEVRGLTPSSLPALRLVQFRSPDLTVDGYRLGDIDLNPSLSPEVPLNVDRAQLARLGG